MATSPGKDGLTAIISRSKMSQLLKVGPQEEKDTRFCGLWNFFAFFFFKETVASVAHHWLKVSASKWETLPLVSSGTGTRFSTQAATPMSCSTWHLTLEWRISWHRAPITGIQARWLFVAQATKANAQAGGTGLVTTAPVRSHTHLKNLWIAFRKQWKL